MGPFVLILPVLVRAEGIETEVASIWSDAFGLADISADDDFYQLGGHSLIAMKVINEVKKLFGAKLSMAQVPLACSCTVCMETSLL